MPYSTATHCPAQLSVDNGNHRTAHPAPTHSHLAPPYLRVTATSLSIVRLRRKQLAPQGAAPQKQARNEGEWGMSGQWPEEREPDESLRAMFPSRVATAAGHYWGAFSGFKQHYVGYECANQW